MKHRSKRGFEPRRILGVRLLGLSPRIRLGPRRRALSQKMTGFAPDARKRETRYDVCGLLGARHRAVRHLMHASTAQEFAESSRRRLGLRSAQVRQPSGSVVLTALLLRRLSVPDEPNNTRDVCRLFAVIPRRVLSRARRGVVRETRPLMMRVGGWRLRGLGARERICESAREGDGCDAERRGRARGEHGDARVEVLCQDVANKLFTMLIFVELELESSKRMRARERR